MGTIADIVKIIEEKVITRSAVENKTFKEVLDEEIKKLEGFHIDERR